MHLGSTLQKGGDVYEVLRVEQHRGYKTSTFPYKNDIAIITLTTNVNISKSVNRICLPKPEEVFVDKEAQIAGEIRQLIPQKIVPKISQRYFSGWGLVGGKTKSTSDVLKKADVYITPNPYMCQFTSLTVDTNMLCAKGKSGNACQV